MPMRIRNDFPGGSPWCNRHMYITRLWIQRLYVHVHYPLCIMAEGLEVSSCDHRDLTDEDCSSSGEEGKFSSPTFIMNSQSVLYTEYVH